MQYLYFAVILGSLIKSVFFWKFSCSSSSAHPVQSWNSKKKFCIRASNIVCGVRGRVEPVWTTSFPGFSPTRPYGAREEREPGNEVIVAQRITEISCQCIQCFHHPFLGSMLKTFLSWKSCTVGPLRYGQPRHGLKCLHNLYRGVWNLIFS